MTMFKSIPLAAAPSRLLLALVLLVLGCGDTGQTEVSFALRAAGTNPGDIVSAHHNWTITLNEARLAFGPLLLCPGFQAGELCDEARAEWLDSALVDAIDPKLQPLGSVHGVTGVSRSWMYDLGIVSSLTQEQPFVMPAARALGNNSLVLAGVAYRDDVSVPFEAQLRLQQGPDTEQGVPIIRKSSSDDFDYTITESTRRLTVTFDAGLWVKNINFDTLASQGCTTAAPCAIAPDSQAGRAIRHALVAGQRPIFSFADAP